MRLDTYDLVGLTEISVRAGVTNAAVANWAARHPTMPKPVRTLACGPVYSWEQVARWLAAEDLPNASYTDPGPDLTPDLVEAIVTDASKTNATEWAQVASRHGVSSRRVKCLMVAAAMGEPYGWYTTYRRANPITGGADDDNSR